VCSSTLVIMGKGLKRYSDPNGGHVRMYWTLLDSPAYLALSWTARALYVDLRRKLIGTNNGNIEATLSILKHRGWKSSATLHYALKELLSVGLMAQTRQGGIAYLSKQCSLYRFTDCEVFEHPKQGFPAAKATYDYRAFDKLSVAKALVREARQKRGGSGRKARMPKLVNSDKEAVRPNRASAIEQDSHATLRIVN
jgi:hypothetical protein